MKRVTRFIGQYIAISLLAGAVLLMYSFPEHPKTWQGWVALLGLALPVVVAGEYFGQLLLERNPASQAIERHTKGKSFSWLRIGYFLLLLLIVCAVLVAVSRWLQLGT
jgi:membrane protease YdiL (CAAX protease family)